jgi:hypothetical protein
MHTPYPDLPIIFPVYICSIGGKEAAGCAVHAASSGERQYLPEDLVGRELATHPKEHLAVVTMLAS